MAQIEYFHPPTGSGTTPDLQQVTDVGNTTSNVIAARSYQATGRVVVNTDYTLTDNKIFCLEVVSAGGDRNITLDLADTDTGHILFIQARQVSFPNRVRIGVATGSFTGWGTFYYLTQLYESVLLYLVVNGGVHFWSVISPNKRILTGTILVGSYLGVTYTVNHNLQVTPTGVFLTAQNADTAALFASAYVVNLTPTTFEINFTIPPGAIPLNFLWEVTT